jgi:CRISPR type III-A-associated protein Csm2
MPDSTKKPHQQNQNQQNKSFTELAKEAKEHFGDLEPELLKLKQSTKIDDVFERIETFVQKYAQDITTHQLRNIFKEIKTAKDVQALKLIRPQLAYIGGRLDNKKNIGKSFVAFLDGLIKEVKNDAHLENFKDFMEAIVAYHKFNPKN